MIAQSVICKKSNTLLGRFSLLIAIFLYLSGCNDSGSDASQPAVDTGKNGDTSQDLASQASCPTLKILALDKAKFPTTPPSKVVLKHSSIGKSGDLTLAWWREGNGGNYAPPVYLDTIRSSQFSLCEDGITFGDLPLTPQNVNRIRQNISPDSIKYVVFVPIVGSPNLGGGSYKVLYYRIYVRATLTNLPSFKAGNIQDYGFLFDVNPSPPATAL